MPSRLRIPLTIFGTTKNENQRLQKSSLYLLGRFQEKYQRAKNNSVQPGQNFQNSLPTKLVGSLKPHFCPSWTEVKKPISTQVVSKSKITSTQLAEKSGFNFYTDCAEVNGVAKRGSDQLLRLIAACLNNNVDCLDIYISPFRACSRIFSIRAFTDVFISAESTIGT